jgi:glycosyltransferase involved in cell wall biosynthesis
MARRHAGHRFTQTSCKRHAGFTRVAQSAPLMDTAELSISELAPQRAQLRIAMVTETYPPEVNGVARTMGLMVDGLRARDHAVQLIRPRQGSADHAENGANFEELLRPGMAIPRYAQLRMGLPARQALLRAWAMRRPDIVHVATEGPLGWSALSAAQKLRLPVATDFHTNFHAYSRHYGAAWLSRPVAAYLRKFHNRADCTLVPTEQMSAELAALGFERLRVVGRGVNAQTFHPDKRSDALRARWQAGPDTLVALCVSRFAAEKNFPLLIEGYQAMQAVRSDSRLVLVGDGPLAEELRNAGVGIVVAGRKVNGELSMHYASADAFLFPSTTETFGNVTLEAMASGLGIAAYDYAAARQYLRHGESALLAAFNQPADFVAQCVELARDLPRVRALGAAARRIAAELSWERVVGDFEHALLEAIDVSAERARARQAA